MDFVENVGRRSFTDNGEFTAMVEVGSRSLNGYERNGLFKNLGGAPPRFVDVGYVAGCDRIEDGRGVGVLDIEGDGDLDLVVQNLEGKTVLLVNQGATGRWLQVRLRGRASNRDAVGARVVIEAGGRRQVRQVTGTRGYASGQSLVCHFGLGAAERVDRLTVHWPSGGETELADVATNRRLTIVE